MKLKYHLSAAWGNFINAKFRVFLAIMGILVGTASVVGIVSGGKLATREALSQIKTLGTDLLAVSLRWVPTSEPDRSNHDSKLTLNMIKPLKYLDPHIYDVAPYTMVYAMMNFDGHEVNGTTVGTMESLASIVQLHVKEGRFVSDLDQSTLFCVLGADVYNKIKEYDEHPVGKQLRIGKNLFTIIGILEPWAENGFIFENFNRSVFIPASATLLLFPYATLDHLIFKLQGKVPLDSLQAKLEEHFNRELSNKKLYFRSPEQLLDRIKKQEQIFTLFVGLIGGISLVVGGIGVMNVMLMSVTERHREIGIRLAVGARRRDIQILFLIEAILLSFLGGVLGVVLGLLTSGIIAYIKHWQVTLFLSPPLIGFCAAILTGVFFGFYPAYKASQLTPIETLRAE
jgi:putative ABC transport system permease protein